MRLFFTFAFLGTLFSAPAQTGVTGTVSNAKGFAIPGVSIALKGTYDGGTTDSSGVFSFETSEKGSGVVTATAIGYKPLEQNIVLAGAAITVNIVLREEITELKAVVISAGAFEASDKKKATVLNSIDMLTTASANADVTGAVKTLPGAQQVGESEGLFVRGGTAAETRTYIDGSLVNNFFYSSVPNVAQRGRFSPWIFKGTVFSTGGYSALYGQALSSALILESIDMPEQSEANAGVTVLSLSGGYQHLAKNKKASFGMSYGYTNLLLPFHLIQQKQDFSRIPVYHTGDANFRIKTSGTGMLKYYGYASANKLAFTENSIDTIGYKEAFVLSNGNMYHNLSFREAIGKGWKINLGTSYTNNRDQVEGGLQNARGEKVVLTGLGRKNFWLDSRSRYANAKLVLEKKLTGLSAFRIGTEYNYSNEKPVYKAYNGMAYPQHLKEHLKSFFAEGDVYLTNNIAAKFGSRLEHSSLLRKMNVAPRVSLAYKTGASSQASLAYGIFYQNPESRYLPSTADLTFSKAAHYIAQYQKVQNNRTLRAEVFYKKYHHLVKTGFENGREIAVNNHGFGEAKGLDIFWRDRSTFKQLDYWVSYSYLDTKRDFANYPFALPPHFAARHTGSLVVKKFVSSLKTQFNGSYTYASGRPYYHLKYDAGNSKYVIDDKGETKDFSSMSLSVNYLPNVFKKGAGKFTVFVFSVTNVLNTYNEFGYKYSYNGYRKEAIVPPARMFLFLGAFISFGVDRSQEVINSNL